MPVASGLFSGRDDELLRLRDVGERARIGAGGALIVGGDAGIGKTALLDQLCEGASGLRVVRATGVETEMELPFAALDAVLRPISIRPALEDLRVIDRAHEPFI